MEKDSCHEKLEIMVKDGRRVWYGEEHEKRTKVLK